VKQRILEYLAVQTLVGQIEDRFYASSGRWCRQTSLGSDGALWP
jgi:hypothetical protein